MGGDSPEGLRKASRPIILHQGRQHAILRNEVASVSLAALNSTCGLCSRAENSSPAAAANNIRPARVGRRALPQGVPRKGAGYPYQPSWAVGLRLLSPAIKISP